MLPVSTDPCGTSRAPPSRAATIWGVQFKHCACGQVNSVIAAQNPSCAIGHDDGVFADHAAADEFAKRETPCEVEIWMELMSRAILAASV